MRFSQVGFSTFEGIPYPPSGHTHDEFEISTFFGGPVTMLFAGRRVTVQPGWLVVHWGMLPHQMLDRDPAAKVAGVHVPLAWVLGWGLPPAFISRLLALQPVLEPPGSAPADNLALLRDWRQLLKSGDPAAAELVSGEIRMRLLRAARFDGGRKSRVAGVPGPTLARAIACIARQFREPLSLSDIATAAGVSPRQLTRVFRQQTGRSVGSYILQLRLSRAQRLLATTDRTILDVMLDSGFACPTRFYRDFKHHTGLLPRKFRLAAAENSMRIK